MLDDRTAHALHRAVTTHPLQDLADQLLARRAPLLLQPSQIVHPAHAHSPIWPITQTMVQHTSQNPAQEIVRLFANGWLLCPGFDDLVPKIPIIVGDATEALLQDNLFLLFLIVTVVERVVVSTVGEYHIVVLISW